MLLFFIMGSLPKDLEEEVSLYAVKGLGEVDQQAVPLFLAVGLAMEGIQ